MRIKLIATFCLLLWQATTLGQTRHWQTTDGLPTDEVRQIVPLPNHQMLVNCEGVFCITDGAGFMPVPCDRRKAYLMKNYSDDGYAQQWQGDSLLWLRDFYRIYLFDLRTRTFRYDIGPRLKGLKSFTPSPSDVKDWQGGTWTCTIGNGIFYTERKGTAVETVNSPDPFVGMVRGAAELRVTLSDGRLLQSQGMNQLSYTDTHNGRTVVLNEKLPQLNKYRHIVGACRIDSRWVVIYTQNGACMLDTKADTLAAFAPSSAIGEFSDKYNCMLRDKRGRLWIGTQNGLFESEGNFNGKELYKCRRVEGLSNNCIRSLVLDADGHLWAGTSCGISRITPTVINYGEDDGMPSGAMMERAACLTDDGRLAFVTQRVSAIIFHPKWLADSTSAPTPILTRFVVNGNEHALSPDATWELKHNENYLTFLFSVLDYAHPSHVRYRYRLRPLETEWHLSDKARGFAMADYKSLPPGHYTFEAQAASTDGKWSEALTQNVTICPPLWLTWWAKTAYALLAITALALMLTSYLKRKKAAMERENDDRVNRLFEQREEARHQFAQNAQIDPSKIGINEEEERLTVKLIAAVEAHLSDEEYNVDQLARDVALSRTNLYVKLRNMLGISPADFIRNVRLKRAAQLLADTSLSVGEVASRVGFATPRNFSASFKKTFGVLPSEYRSPNKQQ
jgi:AraC-like DNA-binding protein